MATELKQLPDVCRRKHGGSITSESANIRVHPQKKIDRYRILNLAIARGDYGITVHEAAGALGKEVNRISGRLTELKASNELEPNGQERNNAAVLIVPKKQKELF